LVCLELEEPEDGDRVVVADPPELASDQGRDLRRGRERPYRSRVETERREVVHDRAPGLVAVHLLGDVTLEIGGEAVRDRIAGSQDARALERLLHQRDHRPRDVVGDRQEPRKELASARVVEQETQRRSVPGKDELELETEARAGRSIG
jgi:hypothetical protein